VSIAAAPATPRKGERRAQRTPILFWSSLQRLPLIKMVREVKKDAPRFHWVRGTSSGGPDVSASSGKARLGREAIQSRYSGPAHYPDQAAVSGGG
jgi:hypothetical protein